MTDVAIVGIGIHPFGRHDGVSGRAMGVHAVRAALRDAGIGWSTCSSRSVARIGGNADTMVSDLGLTGLQFINVKNGCAAGGSSLAMAYNAIQIRCVRPRHGSGSTSTSWRVRPGPQRPGVSADWYGETGLMLTTQFFGMKIQRYLHDHGIDPATLAAIAAKAYRNGVRNPNAWRRQPLTETEILAAPMVAHPLTQYMFCSPGEGGVALLLSRADHAHRYNRSSDLLARRGGAQPAVRLVRGVQPVARARARRLTLCRCGACCVRASRHSPGRRRCRAGAGHGSRSRADASRRVRVVQGRGARGVAGVRRDRDQRLLAGQHRRRLHRQRRADRRVWVAPGLRGRAAVLRGAAGERQVPGDPSVGFTHVYGAPGISACTVLSR